MYINFNITCEQIKKIIEKTLEIEDLSVKKRNQNIVIARQLYCFFAKKYTNEKLFTIGLLVNISHATVIQSSSKIETDLKLNYPLVLKPYKRCLKEIEKIIFPSLKDIKLLIEEYENKINELKKFLNE